MTLQIPRHLLTGALAVAIFYGLLGTEVQCTQAEARPSLADLQAQIDELAAAVDSELFFVFDDDVAQVLYGMPEFDVSDVDTRRVWVSVGNDRFINRRTLSFSQKQSESKVSKGT